MELKNTFHLIVFFLFIQCSTASKYDDFLNSSYPLKQLIDSLKIDKNKLSILVDKSDYKLSLVAGEMVVKEYPVVFGGNPVNDKLREGDKCTPEGSFKVRDYYPHAKWSKFIWIDYPTEDSWKKHKKAKEEGAIPKDARIGGEIGIHGVPKGYDSAIPMKMNWTLGCVSLKNEDVNEIYSYVFKGMKVNIRK